eukprot:CAMPEP_0195110914 /NCGR_PEP_ID=MMETSP0448-20130528/94324_1 /TAXON_ID=66468 /ORGANISM="Heterocapsa triquestra, Strain CCMP 448" /LENGTH=385 /DNA_ID=CAMNT_0040147655 /DNA_START=60 /DNA_END=1215 /DNA_ORIENTATION=-
MARGIASMGAHGVWARGREPVALRAQAVSTRTAGPRASGAQVRGAATVAGAAAILAMGERARGRRGVRAAPRAQMRASAGDADAAGAAKGREDKFSPDPAATKMTKSAEEARTELEAAGGDYERLSEGQRSAVSGFFFPDEQELDMDKSMPLEDHLRELREGALRAALAAVICVGGCLAYYKELAQILEGPAQVGGEMVKFVQLAPGEFFFVSVKAAIAVGLLLAFPYALFEAALYFSPALTRSERDVVGPVVLASSVLFYGGAIFSYLALDPAALGFFLSYGQDVIESQFSIDQYFEFILSMGFATGIAFQVPVLQVVLGLVGVLKSEQLFSVWRYVVVGSAVVGAILTPSTDPITQLLLSGALCVLYFVALARSWHLAAEYPK